MAAEVKRVLVVEDSPDNRKILRYRLRRMGNFVVEEACNGIEALERLEAFTPDLIIMDINMPLMNGLEVTRAVRSVEGPISQIPILLLTAQVSNGYAEEGFAAGCTDYLAKPIVDPQILQAKVYACLGLIDIDEASAAETPSQNEPVPATRVVVG